jgi:hypothetical protein
LHTNIVFFTASAETGNYYGMGILGRGGGFGGFIQVGFYGALYQWFLIFDYESLNLWRASDRFQVGFRERLLKLVD